MPNTLSAKKRVRQIARRTIRNTKVKSKVKTFLRTAREAVNAKKKTDTAPAVQNAISQLAKAAQKGVIHKRNAARKISRLMKAAHARSSAK